MLCNTPGVVRDTRPPFPCPQFGKVHKGLWRGMEVAVRTMILPANMSGKEKRERMAVMEAAISSSLAHPNIGGVGVEGGGGA